MGHQYITFSVCLLVGRMKFFKTFKINFVNAYIARSQICLINQHYTEREFLLGYKSDCDKKLYHQATLVL